jgi:hypothetical protein
MDCPFVSIVFAPRGLLHRLRLPFRCFLEPRTNTFFLLTRFMTDEDCDARR